jgi:hypothetical protein
MMNNAISDLSMIVADATETLLVASEAHLEPQDVDTVMRQVLGYAKDLNREERASYVSILPAFRKSLEEEMENHQVAKVIL